MRNSTVALIFFLLKQLLRVAGSDLWPDGSAHFSGAQLVVCAALRCISVNTDGRSVWYQRQAEEEDHEDAESGIDASAPFPLAAVFRGITYLCESRRADVSLPPRYSHTHVSRTLCV